MSRPKPAPPTPPAHPPPPLPYPPPHPRRRWPITVAAAVGSAALAATVAAVITANVADTRTDSSAAHTPAATVTVTATPPAAPKPAPLPAADADRRTCNAWLAAGNHIHAASAALSVLPNGMTILDQAVRENPDWTAAVHTAADQYGRAGDILAAGIAPGTTTILGQAATTAASALHTLSTAYGTFDAANGNAYHVMRETADTMDVLCERLAPR